MNKYLWWTCAQLHVISRIFFHLLTEQSDGLFALLYPIYLLWCEIMHYHPAMCCQVTTNSSIIANKALEIKCLLKHSKDCSRAYFYHGTDIKRLPNNSKWSLYPYQSQRKIYFINKGLSKTELSPFQDITLHRRMCIRINFNIIIGHKVLLYVDINAE